MQTNGQSNQVSPTPCRRPFRDLRVFWPLQVLPRVVILAWIAQLGSSLSLTGQLAPQAAPDFQRGAEIARKHCASCHLYPAPDLLDQATWKLGTMPFLRARLGIDRLNPSDPAEKIVLDEWDLAWKFYLESAPLKPKLAAPRAKLEMGLKQFASEKPVYRPNNPLVTLVQCDPAARQIYVGNGDTKTLDVLDSRGALLSELVMDSPPVSLARRKDGWFCTLIGRVAPHDQRLGKLVLLTKTNAAFSNPTVILSDLPRPAHFSFGDLNHDDREDLVMSGFGNIAGELAVYMNAGGRRFVPEPILDRPGSVRTELHDFDKDGQLDILVMMAQSREGIYILLNKGAGHYVQHTVVEQHPAWGYSGFQMLDFDGNGAMDILATNGDNGEYPSCTKNYHGIRLYLSDGTGRFQESFFFPLNGAFKALAEDFDGDGDRDIAAISYFPDYENSPEESFVYLENTGRNQFKPFSFVGSAAGRWLVMDAGDIDGDGDLDLVLGAANRTPYAVASRFAEQWKKEPVALLILRNRRYP